MITELKRIGYLLLISFILGLSVDMLNTAYSQEQEESLEWSIETSKKTFYPGEPILLTLNIKNMGRQEVEVGFGPDGIGVFSMEIYDSSNKVMAKGGRIERYGFSTRGTLKVFPNIIGQRPVVLNQWCSTLLPPGQYHIICYAEPYTIPKVTDPNIKTVKARYLPKVTLELDIEIMKMDESKFKQILADLAKWALKENVKGREERANRRIAREMLAFAESDLAVSYQLKVLRAEPSTRLKWDVINSLARSGTIEAADGLIQIINEKQDCAECLSDVKPQIIDAVYRLRETGKPDIINATGEFVAKYKRPILAEPAD